MIQADPATLKAVLAKAAPGDVIELTPGDYGRVSLKNLAFERAVTLRAVEGAGIEAVAMRTCAGLTFEGFHIQSRTSGADIFRSDAGERIRFVDGSIRGTADRTARGAVMVGPRTEILRTRFGDVHKGAIFTRADGGELSDCDFRGMRSDGAAIGETVGFVIARNAFTDFTPELAEKGGQGTHPDGIQIMNARLGVRLNAGLRIIANYICGLTQGIFFGDKGRGGADDITVWWNLVHVQAPRKISLDQVRGYDVRWNVLPRWEGEEKPSALHVRGGHGVCEPNFVG